MLTANRPSCPRGTRGRSLHTVAAKGNIMICSVDRLVLGLVAGDRRRLRMFTSIACAMWLTTSADAQVLPFVVTSTVDASDVAPGNGVCASSAGECTLRAAVQEAQALPGEHLILLPAGMYRLTLAGRNEEETVSGDLDIWGHITIQGQLDQQGVQATVIDGGRLDRLFHVRRGSDQTSPLPSKLTLSHLTLQNGDAGEDGGGVLAYGGVLRLDHVVVTRCHWSAVSVGQANADFTDTRVDENIGTGIRVDGGAVTLRRSSISRNAGLGVRVSGHFGFRALLSAEDTAIAENGSGGVHASFGADARLARVTVTGHRAQLGAGIAVEGSALAIAGLSLSDSTIAGNSSAVEGGGLYLRSHIDGNVSVTIVRSSIVGNTAATGGAIAAHGSRITLLNSTVSGNAATAGPGGAIFLDGPSPGSSLSLVNSTLTANASAASAAVMVQGAVVSATNALIANNDGPDANCRFTGPVEHGTHNLEYPGLTCRFVHATDVHADPVLRPLAHNGGPTRTHRLGLGSAALDAGDPETCAGDVAGRDQRGARRLRSAAPCDIGAYEGATAPFTDGHLQAGLSLIRASHIDELRASISDHRVRWKLPEPPWTDPVLTGVLIKAIHVEELRVALLAVYDAAERQRPVFVDPTLKTGVPIRAVHVNELRSSVTALDFGN